MRAFAPELASQILNRTVEGQTIHRVHVAGKTDSSFEYQID